MVHLLQIQDLLQDHSVGKFLHARRIQAATNIVCDTGLKARLSGLYTGVGSRGGGTVKNVEG